MAPDKENATEDDRQTWIRHSFSLSLFTSFFHVLQFVSGTALYLSTRSPALLTYALDAVVSTFAALILAVRIQFRGQLDASPGEEHWRFRIVAFGYMAASLVGLYLGVSALWSGHRPARNILGIVLAAISMLVVPIIGSYMKVLAVELRNQTLKAAAVFTFGNSYLSMVLLIALLLNTGMDMKWGDPVGALVMFPFMMQKGIQILVDEGKNEYIED